jgi:hypothetical protein
MFWGHAPIKKGGKSIFEGIFRFGGKKSKKIGAERRELQKEGTTERGNDCNDATLALFKNLVF